MDLSHPEEIGSILDKTIILDFCEFAVLKSLHLEAENLLIPENADLKPIASGLPHSLQSLSLDFGWEEFIRYDRKLLRDLELPSQKGLPHLREIYISMDRSARSKRIAEDLASSAEDFNVQYHVFGGSFSRTIDGVHAR